MKAVRGGLLAAVALLACAAPVQADTARTDTARTSPARTATGSTAPGNWLLLTVDPGGAPPAAARGGLLLCDPPRGHRHAADACAELAAADGRIADIPPKDLHCPMIHAPVTVHAHGRWGGRPVAYTETFPNRCAMAARTGSVFALDGP